MTQNKISHREQYGYKNGHPGLEKKIFGEKFFLIFFFQNGVLSCAPSVKK